MAIPVNKTEFGEYCLRKLGGGVVEINVTDAQVDDRIDEALEYFHMFHVDGLDRVFIPYTITQSDIDNKYITIQEPVLAIINVFSNVSGLTGTNWASGMWQYKYDIFSNINFGSGKSYGIGDYILSMQYLNTMDVTVGVKPRFQYSPHSNKLYVDHDWSNYSVGDTIAYEAYIVIDPDEYPNVWNDIWLKKYAVALIGEQWGSNLQKFQNVELPGGITLNGDELRNQYAEEKVRLEEELEDKFVAPPDFFVG
jgi:hypothetical protein